MTFFTYIASLGTSIVKMTEKIHEKLILYLTGSLMSMRTKQWIAAKKVAPHNASVVRNSQDRHLFKPTLQ